MNVTDPATKNEVLALREGIRAKYRAYQQNDPDRFPDLNFNTNRSNYEALRDSFEEEFYTERGHDQKNPNISIPSTNTLALLFTDDDYLPGKKILNTCRSYAEGPAKLIIEPDVAALTQRPSRVVERAKWMLSGGLIGLFCLGLLAFINRWLFTPAPGNLFIDRPAPQSTVPQEVIVEGKVAHAETVWLIVRPNAGQRYFVQPPIMVQPNGFWIGVIYVGGWNKYNEGLPFQIRAVVNPAETLQSGMVLRAWPGAELSSEIREVVRGKSQQ